MDMLPSTEAAPVLPTLLQGSVKLEHQAKQSDTDVLRIVREVRRLKVACVSVPEAGHLVPTAQIGAALAQRGHRTQLVSFAHAAKKVPKACEQMGCDFVGLAADVPGAGSGVGKASELQAQGLMIQMFQYLDEQLRAPLKDFLQAEKPDVVVADFATPCAWEVADECGIPVVLNMPGLIGFCSTCLDPSRASEMYWKYLRTSRAEADAVYWFFSKIHKVATRTMCLVNSFWGLEAPQPLPPNFVLTGTTAPRPSGLEAKQTSNPEFNTWLDWVRSRNLRIVYITMGSMQVLEDFQVKAIYEGLSATQGCAFAWSLKSDQQSFLPGGSIEELPERFFIREWLPQGEALHLADVALVITHCGFGGLNETIAAGKPIVALPFRADQPLNAAIAEKRGLCEVLQPSTLTAGAVTAAVAKVLQTPAYGRCARELQACLLKTRGAEACVEALEDFAEQGYEAPVAAAPPASSTQATLSKTLLLLGALCAGVALARRFH
eukprot:TRINITY_DN90780_c0_g1_i1.p1 TRINITY_DN90780_c0_g1~~TRINITY_DN90780_c0_g1_i1.p1  ORF type:complete len:503 (-),score=117.75 TRINITY_DN90780_c0_g1_i1:133-1608(-)